MAKILLVEDDNNLREIYGERLMAEGYDIVSASDGEEALQTAVTEKPDLIISDVMMPKISGFDMLDILRQTPETKNVKIIMMTALSQAEDKTRADNLGADKYLVKSQVTLEDVARVVHDILEDGPPPEISTSPAPQDVAPTMPAFDAQPVMTMPEPVATPVAEPSVVIEPTMPVIPPAVEPVVAAPAVEPTTIPEPVVMAPPTPVVEELAPVAVPAIPQQPVEESPVQPEIVAPPVVEPTMPAPEPVVMAPPVEPVSAPPVIQMPPVINAPASNPISDGAVAAPTVVDPTPTSVTPATPIDDSMAQAAQVEIDEVAKQIESFVAANGQVSEHQEPVNEPTEQDLIHAQNAADEPVVVAAQPASPVNQTIPPAGGVDIANPEPASSRKKIISPVSDEGFSTPDIHALYEQEMAKEAADSPVINPTVIDSPVANDDPANPIAGVTQEDVAPPPLETIDASQISGVHYGDDDEYAEAQVEAEAKAALAQAQMAQQMPAQTPEISQTQSGIPPAPEEPVADPNDPNNFAL